MLLRGEWPRPVACLIVAGLLVSSWTAVNSQVSPDNFHGHTAAGEGSVLWFDGEDPENLTSWEWETHGATGRTWHWDGDNDTTWTTWLWSSTGPEDNQGGGFLLSSSQPSAKVTNGKSEAQRDGTACSPCGGAAWARDGPVLTWTSPPETSNFNFSSWMMQQGNDCWGFTSKTPGWGFIFDNITVTGDKGGPGDGACSFPSVSVGHPSLHGLHGVGVGLGSIGGVHGVGGLGFGGLGFGSFGFRGLGTHFGGAGFGPGIGLGGHGVIGGCPYTGFIARRRRDTEPFDDATDGVDKNPGAFKRWLMKARDFLMSIARASQEDDGKGGWSIPLGNGYIQVGPNLLRKVSGWISGAVLSVLGGRPIDPETQVAIETILLDPHVIEVVRNATEQSDAAADASSADASSADASSADASSADASSADASSADASSADASSADASSADASSADASSADASTADASTADASTADASSADTS